MTEVGFALNVTVGAPAGGGVVPPPVTVTVAEREMLPPGPVQLSEYVVFAVSGPTCCVPVGIFAPVQPPEAVQPVAF